MILNLSEVMRFLSFGALVEIEGFYVQRHIIGAPYSVVVRMLGRDEIFRTRAQIDLQGAVYATAEKLDKDIRRAVNGDTGDV